MEEGSRSFKDMLSLSPHSEWQDTWSDYTDLDVADLMLLDEVGPDDEVGPGDRKIAASVAPGALGPVETHSSVETGMLDPSGSMCQCGTNEDQAGESRTVMVSKNRLRQCPICGMVSREKTRHHIVKKHLPWFWSDSTACWDCCQQEMQASF
ncbi:unnamed protein product [Mytilus coruscus]|uniref:Uncharacterized protein n=1 Tax=Mytilus coruscus TaxID=42192 RepID=A0A6J8DCV4_MYTCO|nr:unnamed protein product [Mytilus coruscus]